MINFDNLSVDNLICLMGHINSKDIFNFRIVCKKNYRAVEKYFRLRLRLEYPDKKIEANKLYSEQYFSCRPLHQWIQASKNNRLKIEEVKYNFLHAKLKECHYIDDKFYIPYCESADDIDRHKVLILDQANGETCQIEMGWIVGNNLLKIEKPNELSLIDLKSNKIILNLHADNFESINFCKHLHKILFLQDTLILEHYDYSITKLNAKNEKSFVELIKTEKNQIAIKGSNTQVVTKGINNYDDNTAIVSKFEINRYIEVLNIKECAYEKFYLSKNEPTILDNTDYILFPKLNKNTLSYLSFCDNKFYYNQARLGKKSELLITIKLDLSNTSISAFYETDNLIVAGIDKDIFLINKNDGKSFHRFTISERVEQVFVNERYLVAQGVQTMHIWTIVPAISNEEREGAHNLGHPNQNENLLWRYLPYPYSSLISLFYRSLSRPWVYS